MVGKVIKTMVVMTARYIKVLVYKYYTYNIIAN